MRAQELLGQGRPDAGTTGPELGGVEEVHLLVIDPEGLGFGVQGLGFRVQGLGFGVLGEGLRGRGRGGGVGSLRVTSGSLG